MSLQEWEEEYKDKNLFLNYLMESYFWRCYKRLLRNVKLPANPKILELGCGTGFISLFLARHYHASVTLVDFSPNALNFAKSLFQREGVKGQFIYSDFFSLNLDEKFDLVHSQGVIEHFKDPQQGLLLRLHRDCTNPEGHIAIFAPRPSAIYRASRYVIEQMNHGKWPKGYELPIREQDGIYLIEKQHLKVIKSTTTMLEHGFLCRVLP